MCWMRVLVGLLKIELVLYFYKKTFKIKAYKITSFKFFFVWNERVELLFSIIFVKKNEFVIIDFKKFEEIFKKFS